MFDLSLKSLFILKDVEMMKKNVLKVDLLPVLEAVKMPWGYLNSYAVERLDAT